MGAGLELDAFPLGVQPHVCRLLGEPLLPPNALREQIDTHLKLLREAFLTSSTVDQDLASALTDSCLALVWMVRDDTPESVHRWIQVAAHYFALSEDGQGDFAKGGLADDQLVLNLICGHLGRDDLRVEDR